ITDSVVMTRSVVLRRNYTDPPSFAQPGDALVCSVRTTVAAAPQKGAHHVQKSGHLARPNDPLLHANGPDKNKKRGRGSRRSSGARPAPRRAQSPYRSCRV